MKNLIFLLGFFVMSQATFLLPTVAQLEGGLPGFGGYGPLKEMFYMMGNSPYGMSPGLTVGPMAGVNPSLGGSRLSPGGLGGYRGGVSPNFFG